MHVLKVNIESPVRRLVLETSEVLISLVRSQTVDSPCSSPTSSLSRGHVSTFLEALRLSVLAEVPAEVPAEVLEQVLEAVLADCQQGQLLRTTAQSPAHSADGQGPVIGRQFEARRITCRL